MEYQEKVPHPEGGWALEQLPRELVTAPSLAEFQKDLNNTLRCNPWDGAVQGQELDTIILMSPFQLQFHDDGEGNDFPWHSLFLDISSESTLKQRRKITIRGRSD